MDNPRAKGAGTPLLPPVSRPPQPAAARVKAADAGAFGLIDWGIGVFCGRLLPPFGGGPFPQAARSPAGTQAACPPRPMSGPR